MNRFDLSRSFEGRTALVTGGSSGIGKACVEAIADCGGTVAITYAKGRQRAEELQERIGVDRSSIHALDMADHSSIHRLIGEVRDRWPEWARNGALIHSAAVGTATVKNYVAEGADELGAFYGINAIGTHHLMDATMGVMQEEEGQARRDLVGISSVGSTLQIFPGFNIADGVSKAAVDLIYRNFAARTVLDPRFRINVVCPGATDTPMLQASFLDHLSAAERADFDARRAPKGRVTPPEEIADLIVYLCSDLAHAVHGATIDASSGLALRPGLITEM